MPNKLFYYYLIEREREGAMKAKSQYVIRALFYVPLFDRWEPWKLEKDSLYSNTSTHIQI